MSWRSKNSIRIRLLAYLAISFFAVVATWFGFIPAITTVFVLPVMAVFAYSESCTACNASFLGQKGKNVLWLGEKCEKCGEPIS